MRKFLWIAVTLLAIAAFVQPAVSQLNCSGGIANCIDPAANIQVGGLGIGAVNSGNGIYVAGSYNNNNSAQFINNFNGTNSYGVFIQTTGSGSGSVYALAVKSNGATKFIVLNSGQIEMPGITTSASTGFDNMCWNVATGELVADSGACLTFEQAYASTASQITNQGNEIRELRTELAQLKTAFENRR